MQTDERMGERQIVARALDTSLCPNHLGARVTENAWKSTERDWMRA